jgi:glucokinase
MVVGITDTVSNEESFNLVGDIGGTNARFAIVSKGNSELISIETLQCEKFKTIQQALQFYLSSIKDIQISLACIASAGTVHLDTFKPANNDWVINKSDVSSALNNIQVSWINDFNAQALATTMLSNNDVVTIKAGIEQPNRLRLAIGPGTGLGVCGLIRSSGEWVSVTTQGGHSDLAPNTSLEIEILTLLKKKFGHVAVERVLSGPGIVNLYEALCQINGKDILFHSPSEITAAAINPNPDYLSKETLLLFCQIFGSVTGSIALTTGSLGGVYITSDLVRNFLDFFISSEFVQNFENKGRMKYYMADIPIYLSKKENMGLLGATHYLNHL